jgi:hypothetical protein
MRPQIIAIDGELGAGKTTFAANLSRENYYSCIHLDDFLAHEQAAFVTALKLHEIRKALELVRGPFIVEGVCVLQVLDLLGVTPSMHIFLHRAYGCSQYKQSPIVLEVETYIREYRAPINADMRLCIMQNSQTNQLDVDIAYIKAKTVVSSILALGGVVATIVGAFVLNSGIQTENITVLSILGAEVTAKGIGAVILSSSVLWAYFSYLSRPNYSRTKESRTSLTADGAHENYEFESSTMASTRPMSIGRQDVP